MVDNLQAMSLTGEDVVLLWSEKLSLGAASFGLKLNTQVLGSHWVSLAHEITRGNLRLRQMVSICGLILK